MSGETVISLVGNLTADPELRFTPSGAAVADFTVASTPRTFDSAANEWRDGNTLFMRCSVWREAAENVAESLRKGMRVIVQGRLTQRSFETRDGVQRSVIEMQVDEVGPSLRRAKAQVTRSGVQPASTMPPAGGALPPGQGAFNGQYQQQTATVPQQASAVPPAQQSPPSPPADWSSYGQEAPF